MDTFQAIKELSERYKKIQRNALGLDHSRSEQYRTQLTALVSQYKRVKAKKPPVLTIPVIFGRTHNENFLSHYLAYILNPQQNGIGTAPLEALFKLCKIDLLDISLQEAHPLREYSLENGRIDLLIECGDNLVLGIENKIFSPEGSSQTPEYARVMDDLYPDILHPLIYLTRAGDKARSDKFISISYKMLLSAFKQISVAHVTEHRKLSLWEDFLEHLEVYIMSPNADHFIFSEKSLLYLEHRDMIQDLSDTFKNDWADAISYIDTSLEDRLSDGPWIHNFSSKNSWQQIYKSNWDNKDLFIHFEWIFGPSEYRHGKLLFFIDVEYKRAGEALALFNQRKGELEKIYRERGFDFRPTKRNIAIAYKEYAIEQNFDRIVDRFVEAFDDMKFIIPMIDEVVAELKMKA